MCIYFQKTFQSFDMASRMDRGSHISLNEPPIPKHRKTRFQQSSLHKIKPSKGNADMLPPKKHSYDSLDGPPTSVSNPGSMKKARRSSFMPSKSLASATKLINQHLFGIQSANSKGKRQGNITLIITFHYFFITPAFFHFQHKENYFHFCTGKSPDKSMSQDSSEGSPNAGTHRRSKSILKNKSESSVSNTFWIPISHFSLAIIQFDICRRVQSTQRVNDSCLTMHLVQQFPRMVRYVHKS